MKYTILIYETEADFSARTDDRRMLSPSLPLTTACRSRCRSRVVEKTEPAPTRNE